MVSFKDFSKRYYITSSNWGVGSKTKFASVIDAETGNLYADASVESLGNGVYAVRFSFPQFATVLVEMGKGFRLTHNSIGKVMYRALKKINKA